MFKFKVATNEKTYKEVVLRRAIIVCWFLLAICFMVKIFGGNFFNIICENKTFIKICNYIDNSWLYYVIMFLNYCLTTSLYVIGVIGKTKLNIKEFLIIILFLIICYGFKFVSVNLALFTDMILMMFICPLILLRLNKISFKKSIIRILIGFILFNLFQIISMFIKNLGLFKIMENNTLIQLIFCLDYYIMLILYVLYSKKILNKKEI